MRSKPGLVSRAIAILIAAAMAPMTNAATPGDACALLSAAQVGAALGVPVGAGTYVTPTFTKTCTWTATTSGGGSVTLNLQGLDQYEGGKKLASYGKSVSVNVISGIGDEAYYLGTDKLVGLIVKKGNVAFKVAVYAHDLPIDKQQTVEKTLAMQVASQL
jgi:hypothetical protein